MRKINLKYSFQLLMDKKETDVLFLHYTSSHRSDSHEIDILHFLETLPILFSPFATPYLSGSRRPFQGTFGFVSDEKKQPDRFLSLTDYKFYDILESDLKKINPTYQLRKKTGETLNNVIPYIKEALSGMNVQEVVSKLAPMSDVLSLNEFHHHFIPLNKEEGTYLLPWSQMQKISSLHSCLETKVHSFPTYSFTNKGREILLYVVNDTFFLIKQHRDQITSATFSSHEKQKVAEEIETFFPFNPTAKYQHVNEITVSPFSPSNWYKIVETTASFVENLAPVPDDLSVLRPFFQKEFGIKARGKIDLWNKGMQELKKEPFSFDYPFFTNMSHETQKNETITRNGEIINNLDHLKTKIQLASFEDSGIIDDTHKEKTDFYAISGRNFKLYTMPDYGEMASKAPSFADIMKKKEVKP